MEESRTCTSLEGHSRARRYARGDSLCFAALEHRARSPKGFAHPTGRQTAQHLSQNDRAALREIHCDRPGRPRKGGGRVPGAAEGWKRGADGKTRVNTCISPFLGNNRPNRVIQKSRLGKSTTNGKNRRRDGSGEEQLVRRLAGRAVPEHIECR